MLTDCVVQQTFRRDLNAKNSDRLTNVWAVQRNSCWLMAGLYQCAVWFYNKKVLIAVFVTSLSYEYS